MSKASRKKGRRHNKHLSDPTPEEREYFDPGTPETEPGKASGSLAARHAAESKTAIELPGKSGTITLPARKNRDGTFTINPGTPEEYLIRDPSTGPPPGDRRQTYAPMVNGPKDLPALRHHIVERTNWLRMDEDRRIEAMRDAGDLERSQLWWVADDVVGLASRIAETIPDETTLANITLPTHAHGFAVFPKPIATFDTWQIMAIDWHPVQYHIVGASPKPGATDQDVYDSAGLGGAGETITGFRMTWWIAPDLGEGISSEMMADPVGMEAMTREVEMQTHRYGEHRMEASLEGRTWVPFGTTSWITEAPVNLDAPGSPRLFAEDHPSSDPRYIRGMEEATEMRKILAALWIVSRSEKITETREAPQDRPERRRRMRAGFGNDPVQVVQLRPRPKTERDADGESGEGGNYHHRWIVSPHLRWQPYGPNSSLRKLILVEGYLKGPEGAPLLDPKKKVWRVS